MSVPETFRLVDTHCHIDLYPDGNAILDEIISQNVCTIAVTNAPFLFSHTCRLAERTHLLLPAIGMHPELVHTHGHQIDEFKKLLPRTRFVGEIGLDYTTKDESVRTQQRQVFDCILKLCADEGRKVLTVHSRRAASDVIAAIGADYPGRVILHWFSGSLRDLRQGLANGFYFSVNPAMVRSEQGMRIVQEIPKDRLLTETDGPFVKCGHVPATPCTAMSVCDALSVPWQCTSDAVVETIQNNFRRLVE